MKKNILLFVVFVSVTFLGYSVYALSDNGLSQYNKSWSWRYKLVVEVETPEGLKTGSSVREVNSSRKAIAWSEINNAPNYVYDHNIKGEAVVVDLGERGLLFALIDGGQYMQAPLAFGKINVFGFDYIENLPSGTKSDLPYQYWPTMVMFKDINDAKTVTRALQTGYCTWPGYRDKKCPVNDGPYIVENNLELLFGKDVSIKSVTVEITDERVTRGIRKYLSWLDNYYNQRLDGNRYGTSKSNYPVANQFAAGAFSTFRSGE